MKKVLAVMLAVAMMLTVVAIPVFADAGISGEMSGEAFMASAIDGVITLGGDVQITNRLNMTKSSTDTLTIEGNGHKISLASGYSDGSSSFITISGGWKKVTFNNLSIDVTAPSASLMYAINVTADEFVVNGGSYQAVSDKGQIELFKINSGTKFNMKDATAVAKHTGSNEYGSTAVDTIYLAGSSSADIENCNISVDAFNQGSVISTESNATATLDGATVSANARWEPWLAAMENVPVFVFSNRGTINILSGQYTATQQTVVMFTKNAFSISGGTFKGNGVSKALSRQYGFSPDVKVSGNLPLKELDFVNNSWLASGYTAVKNADSSISVVEYEEPDPVAEVNGVEYATLKEAMDNAASGDTITMINDGDLGDTATVAANKKIAVDIAGCKLKTTAEDGIAINSGAELTMYDSIGGGEIEHSNTAGDLFFNKGDATLIINGGKYLSNGDYGTLYSNGIVNITGGTLIGVLHLAGGTQKGVPLYIGKGEVNVSGGTFVGQLEYGAMVALNGKINISGGFWGNTDIYVPKTEKYNAEVTISGGYFMNNTYRYGVSTGEYRLMTDENILATGYEVVENTDAETSTYPYKVVSAKLPEVVIDPEETAKADIAPAGGGEIEITPEIKQDIIDTVTNNDAVNNFTNTGVPAVVEANKNEIKELLKDAAKKGGIDDADDEIDSKTSLDSTLYIYLKTALVTKVSDDLILSNEMKFDVTPVVTTTVTSGGESKPIVVELHETASPVKFRLPVSEFFAAGTPAKIYHKGNFYGNALVQTENGKNFVEVVSSNFSEYSYKIEDHLYWQYNTDSGKYGEEGAQRGVARFLFDSGLEDEYVKESKVLFFGFPISDDDVTTNTDSEWKVIDADGYGAFSADLYNLDPENHSTIYAIGFIQATNGESTVKLWSEVQKYAPTFTKNLAEYPQAD